MGLFRLITVVFFALLASHSTSYAKAYIEKIGYTNSNRLYVEVSKKTRFKVFSLKNPDRIVVDIFDASGSGIKTPKYIKNVKSVRFSSDPNKVRIVFDLSKPINISSSSYTKLRGDKYGKITIITSDSSKISSQSFAQKTSQSYEKKKSKPIIVIDAGHGGKDPGALGRYLRTKEKIITLSYAKELYKSLKRTGKYKVYLTRDNDKFISLKFRVEKARKLNADLFISLHANSSPNRRAQGFSVYTLSETASDKEAEKLAARENMSGAIAGMTFKGTHQDIARTLIDLSQRNAMNHSSRFANLAINTIQGQNIKTIHNTHRFAGFAVLTAPDMVSILIELGYLTNKSEEKQLNNIHHKRKVVKGIQNAIDEYFKFKN